MLGRSSNVQGVSVWGERGDRQTAVVGNSVFGRPQGDYYGVSSAVRGDMYFSHAENAARTFGGSK